MGHSHACREKEVRRSRQKCSISNNSCNIHHGGVRFWYVMPATACSGLHGILALVEARIYLAFRRACRQVRVFRYPVWKSSETTYQAPRTRSTFPNTCARPRSRRARYSQTYCIYFERCLWMYTYWYTTWKVEIVQKSVWAVFFL